MKPESEGGMEFILGVVLAISGNCLIACSLALQKYVHNRHQKAVDAAQAKNGPPAKGASSSPLFWVALTGLILGEVGNFAAFGFASPTVVSPLGAVSVIANALLAVLLLGEVLLVDETLRRPVFTPGSHSLSNDVPRGECCCVRRLGPAVPPLPGRIQLHAQSIEELRAYAQCCDHLRLGRGEWS